MFANVRPAVRKMQLEAHARAHVPTHPRTHAPTLLFGFQARKRSNPAWKSVLTPDPTHSGEVRFKHTQYASDTRAQCSHASVGRRTPTHSARLYAHAHAHMHTCNDRNNHKNTLRACAPNDSPRRVALSNCIELRAPAVHFAALVYAVRYRSITQP